MAGNPTRTTADLVGINRRTAIHFYHQLRTIITWQFEEEWAFSGAIEVNESYFSDRRKGKRGWGQMKAKKKHRSVSVEGKMGQSKNPWQ